MTDTQTDDPHREVQRLTEELARKERENADLKQELSRTKNVQDDLWSHDIYIKARRALFGGVIAILGLLAALGVTGFDDFYESLLNKAGNKIDDYFENEGASSMERQIQAKVSEMLKDAKEQMSDQVGEHIGNLIDEKKLEISSMIADTKIKIDEEVAQLKAAVTLDRVALSDQARQIRIGITALAKVEPVKTELPQISLGCDPKFLDDAQIARVGVRQSSEGTGEPVRNGREVFENTLFLDVRETDGTTGAAAEASCILDAVDRVVYGADPKWYSPSEFVRIERKNNFRFKISGWGPTVLTAQVYFIGRRDPESFAGNLKINKVSDADKKYLGDTPLEFR